MVTARYLSIDLKGNERYGPAWLSVRVAVDAAEIDRLDWTPAQLCQHAAEYFTVPVGQVRLITEAEYQTDPVPGDPPPERAREWRAPAESMGEAKERQTGQGALL